MRGILSKLNAFIPLLMHQDIPPPGTGFVITIDNEDVVTIDGDNVVYLE
jgi:hypothetical protein